MKQGGKILILAFVLLIPAAIYIFLRTFGQNEFSVPVYNVDGTIEAYSNDDENILNPHKIFLTDLYDSKGHPINWEAFSENIVILELITVNDNVKKRNYQLNRVSDIFRNENSVLFLRVFEKGVKSTSQSIEISDSPKANVRVFYADFNTMVNMAKFQLALDVDTLRMNTIDQLVLVDNNQRIRGYYYSNDFDAIDRLILEIKILLDQEQDV